VNRSIGHHLDRDVLFGALADCLQKVVPTDRFGIVLPSKANQLQGYVLTKRDVLSESLQSKVFPSEGTATTWVLQNREWFVAASQDEIRDRFPATARVMQEAGIAVAVRAAACLWRPSSGITKLHVIKEGRLRASAAFFFGTGCELGRCCLGRLPWPMKRFAELATNYPLGPSRNWSGNNDK